MESADEQKSTTQMERQKNIEKMQERPTSVSRVAAMSSAKQSIRLKYMKKGMISSNSDKPSGYFQQNTQDDIRKLLKKYDKDQCGVLDPHEMLNLHKELLNKRGDVIKWTILFSALLIVLIINIFANFGFSFLAIQLYKDITIHEDSGFLQNYKTGSNAILGTSSAIIEIPLAYIPLLDVNVINRLHHVSFTAIALTLNNTSDDINANVVLSGFYPTLHYGMDITGFQIVNETSVLLLGPRQENLLIDSGTVLVWGLPGMAVGDVSRVCPGINDPSHARCSVVTTTDIDLTKLSARAAQIKTLASSSSVSVSNICKTTV
eukprot:gene2604-5094_t